MDGTLIASASRNSGRRIAQATVDDPGQSPASTSPAEQQPSSRVRTIRSGCSPARGHEAELPTSATC